VITRRSFSQLSLTGIGLLAARKLLGNNIAMDTTQPNSENLSSTSLIETSHPRISALAKEITTRATNNRAAAMLIHNWVRDEIQFGISSRFYDTTATQVLDEKVGYCNTKVSLFNALLRARGIPTRIRMMDLSAIVLNGLFDPGSPYVDHAITEIFLDNRWIKIDSYIVDKPLADAARRKLAKQRKKAGFGIHSDGNSDWDGQSDSFIQCLNNESIKNYVLKDNGIFLDVADYYRKASAPRNRQNFASKLMIRFGSNRINQQIQAVRTSSAL
jgi:transglutaminase-like putative cysteine protease